MQWRARADKQTLKDARGTWGSLNQAAALRPRGAYALLPATSLLRRNLENAGVHRIAAVKEARRRGVTSARALAEAAYPETDRPRSAADIESVAYHVATRAKISPIVLAKVREGRRVRYVLLDGVHRLVAAIIRRSAVRVLVLEAH